MQEVLVSGFTACRNGACDKRRVCLEEEGGVAKQAAQPARQGLPTAGEPFESPQFPKAEPFDSDPSC